MLNIDLENRVALVIGGSRGDWRFYTLHPIAVRMYYSMLSDMCLLQPHASQHNACGTMLMGSIGSDCRELRGIEFITPREASPRRSPNEWNSSIKIRWTNPTRQARNQARNCAARLALYWASVALRLAS